MKSLRIFILLSFLFLPILSRADVSINEIMYDVSGSDTGREWVEIYNSGVGTVDISGFKFLESAGASNHSLTLSQGTANIPSGGFAIISNDPTKFLLDWSSFSGNLFKASFSSLNNTGGTVLLKDGSLNVLDQVTYVSTQGASGDGNSLQKTNSGWTAGLPTPGSINTGSQNSTTTDSGNSSATTTPITTSTNDSSSADTGSGGSAHSSPARVSDMEEKMEFEISSGRDRLTTVGNRLSFHVVPTKLTNILEQSISYDWSFGDGTTSGGNMPIHSYKFAGDYAVVVNANSGDQQAVSRLSIHVISPEFLLNRVSGGIEITNKSKAEVNLEDWTLFSDVRSFTFPKDTLIPSSKKVIFADDVTGINSDNVKLVNPAGLIFASLLPKPTTEQLSSNTTISTTSPKLSLADIQTKINEVKSTLAKISKNSGLVIQKEAIVSKISPTTSKQETILGTTTNSNQNQNVATVFEATKQPGVMTSLLSLPMKGFNFIKHLFTEE